MAQRLKVVCHGAVTHPIDLRGINVLEAQVVLEAKPWRRHLRDRAKPQPWKIAQLKFRGIALANQKKRIARRHLTEADHRRIWVLIVSLHDPHRAAPRDIDRPIE